MLQQSPLPDDVFQAITELRRFFKGEVMEHCEDYDQGVNALDVAAMQIAHAGINIEMGALLLWPFFVPESVVSDIKMRKPHALIMLAYYAVFLHSQDTTFWFLKGWGRQLLVQICQEIQNEEKFKQVLIWPKKQISP
jgi:hypothetical protein